MTVAPPRTPLDTVIDALRARGQTPSGNDRGWSACCPAHNDSTPSLSISNGNQGVVLHCHAGCSTDNIVAELGLKMADLFDTPQSNGSEIVATYDYTDERGDLLFQVVRKPGKRFLQRRPDGNGGWEWKLGNTRRVVYQLPQVIKGIANGETIFIVEGEKDVDRLAVEKITATCNPHGAGKWRTEYNTTFTGAHVVIVADRDTPGRDHATHIAQQLDGIATSIRTVWAATGKDISDHLAAGLPIEQLEVIDLTQPDDPDPDTPHEDDIPKPTTWHPIDLTDAVAGKDIPPPTRWERTDGLRLIYDARVHWFQGESESCKSWAAQIIAADELKAGHDVLYIDFEDDDRGVVSRFLALGVPAHLILAHLIYIRPDEALRDRQDRWTDAGLDFETIAAGTYSLVIVDGVTEAMTTEGLELISNADIARWMRLIPKRLAAKGAAVIVIDHVTKSTETQGRYAIGGQHKLAGVSGATYRFTTLQALGRALDDKPIEGSIAVTIFKDRPGYVRGRTSEGKVGTLYITSYPDRTVIAKLEPPGIGAPTVDLAIAGRILDHLSTYDGSSGNKIELGVEGKAPRIRDALKWMVEQEWLTVQKTGNGHFHYLTDLGRSKMESD
jgi:hypothetical protein